MNQKQQKKLLTRRRYRIRKKVLGSAERPRLTVKFTNKHLYAQCIDDESGKTLVCVSSLGADLKDKNLKPNLEGAQVLGKLCGDKAKAAKITKVVFDRGIRKYHGRVKTFADSARESLEF